MVAKGTKWIDSYVGIVLLSWIMINIHELNDIYFLERAILVAFWA